MDDRDKKEYELTFLLRAEDAAPEVLGALAKHGAEVTNQGTLARQHLAYPIKKETQAVLGSVTFRLDPERVSALDHDLRFNAQVLRFLMITPPVKKPQGIMYGGRLPDKLAPSPSPRRSEAGPRPAPKKTEPASPVLTNEALEKKLEEILQ